MSESHSVGPESGIAGEERTVLTDFTVQNYQTVAQDGGEEVESRARKLERIKRRGFYSVDEAIEYIGIGRYHYLWMWLYGISSMTQAVEMTLTSVILSDLTCYWDLSLLEEILIPSCVLLAAIPGDYLGGWLADIYGRKIILIIGQIIIAFFGVLSAFCTTYISYLIVRCFVGFGFGIVVMLVIVQVAEICPTAYRATAVSVTFIMWAVGDCYIVLGAWFLEAKYGWQAVVLWAAIPCVILCFVLPLGDESCKYLVISNQVDKAQKTLTYIAEFNKIEMCPGDLEAVEEKRRGRIADIFIPGYRQMTIALLICMFTSGYIYMGNVYDTPYLLAAGYCFGDVSTPDSCIMTSEDLEYTLIICVGEFLSVPLFAVSSELLGRIRASNILSAVVLVVLISCCVCFGKVVLVIELFLTRAFSNAVLLLIYIYTPESYPTYMRSIAFGVVMLAFNLAGIAAVVSVYVVGDTISWAYMWWSFIIAGVILLVTSFFFDKETVGQRLEDNREENVVREVEEGVQSPRVGEPGDTGVINPEDKVGEPGDTGVINPEDKKEKLEPGVSGVKLGAGGSDELDGVGDSDEIKTESTAVFEGPQ